MTRRLKHVSLIAAMLVAPSSVAFVADAASAQEPQTIDLPDGFQGEGVATGTSGTFYAGSRADGRIARGDLRTGTSEVFVDQPLVPMATGLKADVRNHLLWVAGAATGQAAVYDLDTGAGITTFTFTTAPSFINDVVVTRDAAYFMNSSTPVLYRVPIGPRGALGAPQTVTVTGPAAAFGPGINLNGIEATSDGRTLIVVNSATGSLYTVDARTGQSARIDLGGATVPTGDGILLVSGLLVLENGGQTGPNQIVDVRLDAKLTSGEVVGTMTSPLFETATTMARSGSTLVAVNAQFAPPPIDPEPEVVLLPLHG